MLRDWTNKMLLPFIVLIAFVDGVLVAKEFMNDAETQSVGAIVLEDRFEPKVGLVVENTEPEAIAPLFISQAPYGTWDDPWAYFAEEACAVMAYLWYNDLEAPAREAVAEALLSLRDWETANLGTYKDTDLAQTYRLLTEFYGVQAELSYDVNEENLKRQLDSGNLLILPVQNLENPHYGEPGPVYHMLVAYAYEDSSLITNDPGTIRGEGYSYEIQKILEAVQDLNGEVRMIVVSR